MKKLIYTLVMTVMIGVFSSTSYAAEPAGQKALTAEQQAKLERITQRVEEIRDMDKSDLSGSERKELRKELREMKAQARAIAGGGVYLSVGAILIIILLLILIL